MKLLWACWVKKEAIVYAQNLQSQLNIYQYTYQRFKDAVKYWCVKCQSGLTGQLSIKTKWWTEGWHKYQLMSMRTRCLHMHA